MGDEALPRVVAKPWGSEVWWAHTSSYAGKILRVTAGHRLSIQYHVAKDETSYLLSGRLLLLKGPTADALESREVHPGEAWRNRPGEIHAIHALEDCEVLEVSTPELDDVVRLADEYGREGTSAP